MRMAAACSRAARPCGRDWAAGDRRCDWPCGARRRFAQRCLRFFYRLRRPFPQWQFDHAVSQRCRFDRQYHRTGYYPRQPGCRVLSGVLQRVGHLSSAKLYANYAILQWNDPFGDRSIFRNECGWFLRLWVGALYSGCTFANRVFVDV